MRPVLEMIERIGPSDANVLITGENGTGKGVVAQALHSISARSPKPLITVNTGGLPEGVFESELFGHVKGAFTDARADRVGRFELADGGTMFLDEIANITPTQQAKLLRVLETGEFERVGSSKTHRVDVRILSATNSDLHSEVAGGRFREDLLFRLNTIEIRVPPLRERREDIPCWPCISWGCTRSAIAKRWRGGVRGLAGAPRSSWPGNVRELDHSIERAVLMTQSTQIKGSDLALRPAGREGAPRLDDMSLEEVEAFLIKKALARYQGNVSQAASAWA